MQPAIQELALLEAQYHFRGIPLLAVTFDANILQTLIDHKVLAVVDSESGDKEITIRWDTVKCHVRRILSEHVLVRDYYRAVQSLHVFQRFQALPCLMSTGRTCDNRAIDLEPGAHVFRLQRMFGPVPYARILFLQLLCLMKVLTALVVDTMMVMFGSCWKCHQHGGMHY